MFVVGTAGHIDHGKSSLVKALSGIDPDRLPEEKLRGLTIDLGFAWFNLPSGAPVGVVDVPGHERFIKNMVAGVGGIDAVMLVIAADDGWMPQTAEHLDILTLLDIKTGIVVLSKIDLVDSEFLELQKEDIGSRLKGTFLERAPIVEFSAKSGDGKSEILESLQAVLQKNIRRISFESPRLYIDRCFIIKGIGTVVTGTLIEGELTVGQALEICPTGRRVRVRGLQTHKQALEKAVPGSRVAVSLAGAEKDDASRGSALVMPGHFAPTDSLGVKIKMLSDVKHPLKNGAEILVLLGTAIAHARLKLFKKKQLSPGDEDFAVLHLNKNICCRIGDKFIVRRLSPAVTVGGGIVIDWDIAHLKMKKSKQYEILKARASLELGSVVKSELMKEKTLNKMRLKTNSCFTSKQVDDYLASASDIVKAGAALVDKDQFARYLEPAKAALGEMHQKNPWAIGLGIGELSKKLRIPASDSEKVISYLLTDEAIVKDSGFLKLKSHHPHLKPEQEKLAARLKTILSASPLASPQKKEFIDDDPAYEVIINFLRDKGEIIELKNGILLNRQDFQRIVEKLIGFVKSETRVTASQVKDYLKTTRKYVIPLLEKLDSIGVTRREGDYRILGEDV
jgi:selenocysteine-specific elongation factor